MPKPTQLHSKGKFTSIQKPCKSDKTDTEYTDPEEAMRQFQLELCWCIQQLERSLSDTKNNEKQLQETWKVLTVLKNNNQPIIRKRQLMRTHLGDYRAKMAAEEKKLTKMTSKMKIADKPSKPKATYLRKSAFLTTGQDSFRFNFNLAPEHIDSGRPHGNTDVHLDSGNTNKNIAGDNNAQNKPVNPVTTDNTNRFKFSNLDSEFKFNFNVDDK